MLAFNWKFLTPLSLVILIVMALLNKILETGNISGVGYILVMLTANILIGAGAISLVRKYAQSERKRVAEALPTAVPPVTGDPASASSLN